MDEKRRREGGAKVGGARSSVFRLRAMCGWEKNQTHFVTIHVSSNLDGSTHV